MSYASIVGNHIRVYMSLGVCVYIYIYIYFCLGIHICLYMLHVCVTHRRFPCTVGYGTRGSFLIRRRRDHPGVVLALVISNSATH